MTRIGVARIIAAVAAALLLTAGVASASAASWHVGGETLLSPTSLASSTELGQHVTLEFAGSRVECTGAPELKTTTIAPPAGGKIGHLVLNECGMQAPCSLATPTIETKALTIGAATGVKSPEDTLLLKPESGTTFLEFKVEGTTCPLLGVIRLVGKAKFTLPHGEEELTGQELQFHAGNGELHWGSAEVFLGGRAITKLASGKPWSYR
jgi:hypothetical protein